MIGGRTGAGGETWRNVRVLIDNCQDLTLLVSKTGTPKADMAQRLDGIHSILLLGYVAGGRTQKGSDRGKVAAWATD